MPIYHMEHHLQKRTPINATAFNVRFPLGKVRALLGVFHKVVRLDRRWKISG